MVIPVDIITGSSKPNVLAFVNALTGDARFQDPAVIVGSEDLGDIEHDVIVPFDEVASPVSLGCSCCGASNDIKQSLFELWMRRKNREIRPFGRVLIAHPTGDATAMVAALLAPPSGSYIDRIVATQYGLSRVLALCTSSSEGEGASVIDGNARTIGLADVVVTMGSTSTSRARNAIRAINPIDKVFDLDCDRERVSALMTLSASYHTPSFQDHLSWDWPDETRVSDDITKADQISANFITIDTPVAESQLTSFLALLRARSDAELVRAKGLIACANAPERPRALHGIGHSVQLHNSVEDWASADRRTRLVLIGRRLDVGALRTTLSAEESAFRGGAFQCLAAG